MDFRFSEREEMLRKSVREFAENEIPPKMEAMEKTGDFPAELLKPMADLGIMGVITPPEYGGVGLGYVARTIALEELGRVCGAMPMALQVHHMGCAVINDFGTEEQKKKYLVPLAKGETMGVVAVTDPTGGSDVVGMKTSAELRGDKYILNGRKCFITNSHNSDFWVVIARTAEGAKGLSAFIVEKDFPGIMNDEAKFGLAKFFFMRGKDMGFDMTNKKDMQRFMLYYNANIIADRLSKSDEAVSQTVNEGISSKSHYTKKRKKRG